MRYFNKQKNRFHKPAINVDKLWSLLSEEERKAFPNGKRGNQVLVLDVTKCGYFKVRGFFDHFKSWSNLSLFAHVLFGTFSSYVNVQPRQGLVFGNKFMRV